MNSTTQGNLQIIQDGLQFYYDSANPRSYSNLSINTDRLYNLAKNDDYVVPKSGSTAFISDIVNQYSSSYYGFFEFGITDYIQFPGVVDLTNSNYTLQFVINPKTRSTTNPPVENYIFKSDSDDGLYIKYRDESSPEIEFGTINGSFERYNTNLISDTNSIQIFTVVSDTNNGIYLIYWGNQGDNGGQTINHGNISSNPNEFIYPFKVGYLFDTFRFYQFILYDKVLSNDEIVYNINQIISKYSSAQIQF